MKRYIGIDLGTTNSTISYATVSVNGREVTPETHIIKQIDDTGINFTFDPILPSTVYVDDQDSLYVGRFAKKMVGVRPDNVLHKVKRNIGNDWTKTINGRPYRAETVSSYVLKVLKAEIEAKFGGQTIDSAVITVPANFNLNQDNATRLAAKLAGFDINKLYTIAEPTAAVIDFLNEEGKQAPETRTVDLSTGKKRLLLFDLGGGTCDVLILEVSQQGVGFKIRELSISQYTELGGIDFDQKIAAFLYEQLLREKKMTPQEIKERFEPSVLRTLLDNLLNIAENMKKSIATRIDNRVKNEGLSYLDDINLFQNEKSDPWALTNVPPELAMTFNMTKQEYDKIVEDLLYDKGKGNKNLEYTVRNALKDALHGELTTDDIDYVFLVGGMTYYPTIQERLYELFGRNPKKKPLSSINAMTAVSRGAAVYHYYQDSIEIERASATAPEDPGNGNTETGNGKLIEEGPVTPAVHQTIFVRMHAGAAIPLLERGVEAHYSRIITGEFVVPQVGNEKSVNGMKLDLFMARHSRSPIQIKLKSAILKFRRPVPVGSGLVFKVEWTHNREVKVRAWLESDETEMIDVNIGTHEFTEEEIVDIQNRLIKGIGE